MIYNFTPLKSAVQKTEDWIKKEFGGIRTARATSSVLDQVYVESYGSKVPVNQVGNITTEDARSIRIVPWDISQIKAVEKAIVSANLGVSVSVDDKGVRVIFPELTTERRTEVIKIAKEKLEQGKIQLRVERDRVWTDIQAQEKKGGMSEDEKFRFKKEMEKMIEDAGKKLEEMFGKKEKEILG